MEFLGLLLRGISAVMSYIPEVVYLLVMSILEKKSKDSMEIVLRSFNCT
jgi:hypothetical protein